MSIGITIKNKWKYIFLAMLIAIHCFLFYSLTIRNLYLSNISVWICLFFLFVYISLEIISDIKEKTKSNWKYIFFTLHFLALYGIVIQNFNTVRMWEIFYLMFLFYSVVFFVFTFIFSTITKQRFVSRYWDYIYLLLGFLYVFTVPTGFGAELDELVIQEKEQIIDTYLAKCTTNDCNRTFYFTKKNLLEQKYRVHVFNNSDKEKCVSISNTYFDPNLYIFKCGNKEIEVNYLGEIYNN